jgi:MFS family permease
MLAAITMIAGLSFLLAQIRTVNGIQVVFFFLPMGVSFFFNAFQAFMLGVSNDAARPLHITVSLYTFAWSLGFGLGPFISGIAAGYLSWIQNYYLSAGFCVLIAIVVITYRRPKRTTRIKMDSESMQQEARKRPPLYIPGWMGMVIGLIGWLTIATYWPVIATQQGISTAFRGFVEFAYAMAQGLGALALILLGRWQKNTLSIPVFGLIGVSALVVFGTSSSSFFYLAGAALMGLFTAGNILFSVYHCMLETHQASKRIAVNEMMFGLGFLAGPGIAALLHQDGKPFLHAFLYTAGLVGVLNLIEAWMAVLLSRKSRREGLPGENEILAIEEKPEQQS